MAPDGIMGWPTREIIAQAIIDKHGQRIPPKYLKEKSDFLERHILANEKYTIFKEERDSIIQQARRESEEIHWKKVVMVTRKEKNGQPERTINGSSLEIPRKGKEIRNQMKIEELEKKDETEKREDTGARYELILGNIQSHRQTDRQSAAITKQSGPVKELAGSCEQWP